MENQEILNIVKRVLDGGEEAFISDSEGAEIIALALKANPLRDRVNELQDLNEELEAELRTKTEKISKLQEMLAINLVEREKFAQDVLAETEKLEKVLAEANLPLKDFKIEEVCFCKSCTCADKKEKR
jgi:SMC interacting uncharacterized protein involved in chromosome segregation